MKISISQRQNVSNVYKADEVNSSSAAERSGSRSNANRADSIELSGNAQMIQKALEMIENTDATSRKRLEELREQVQNGTYQVPVEQLADLLRSELL